MVADISCDVEGSIEITTRTTTPDDPASLYDFASGAARLGVEGHGPVVLAVDNLPAEFPRDSSDHFGDSLFPLVTGLAECDLRTTIDSLDHGPPLMRAVATHQGELTPDFRYLESALE